MGRKNIFKHRYETEKTWSVTSINRLKHMVQSNAASPGFKLIKHIQSMKLSPLQTSVEVHCDHIVLYSRLNGII